MRLIRPNVRERPLAAYFAGTLQKRNIGVRVMRGSERPDPMSGPLETMSQAYFAGIDRMAKAYEPAVNGLSRYNLELAGLAARRARAWFEIPATLGRCKTPQDCWASRPGSGRRPWPSTRRAGSACAQSLGSLRHRTRLERRARSAR